MRALAVVAVVVALLAAAVAWRARPVVEPVPPPAAAPPATASVDGRPLVVAVSGKVRHPGLVHLPAGARVADAVAAAGGILAGADTSTLNLARKVVDGELIVVGAPALAGPGAGAPPAALIDINTATVAQLQELPGVGPVLAQRIVDYRDQHGGFAAVTDLRKVSGIGDARFNDLKNRVTV